MGFATSWVNANMVRQVKDSQVEFLGARSASADATKGPFESNCYAVPVLRALGNPASKRNLPPTAASDQWTYKYRRQQEIDFWIRFLRKVIMDFRFFQSARKNFV